VGLPVYTGLEASTRRFAAAQPEAGTDVERDGLTLSSPPQAGVSKGAFTVVRFRRRGFDTPLRGCSA
jgi:hypothetical protein